MNESFKKRRIAACRAVADLINAHNRLARGVSWELIWHAKEIITASVTAPGEVAISTLDELVKNKLPVHGAVRICSPQWYQAEIRYLCVHPFYRRSGAARMLLAAAEKSVAQGDCGIMQATIRCDNERAERLFLLSNWKQVQVFCSRKTQECVGVWTKGVIRD